MDKHELAVFKAQAQAELNRLEAQSTAKDVAGKAIGKHGLLYITVIIVVGVGASVVLEESKIAAVIGLVSAALTAILDETERTKAQIEWEYATGVERNAQLTLSLGTAMGLTEDQLDQLFIFAATL